MKTDAKSLSSVGVFGAVLQILFGFSLSFIGLAFFLITLASAIGGLIKNTEQDKAVKLKCGIALGVTVLMPILWLVGIQKGIVMIIVEKFLQ